MNHIAEVSAIIENAESTQEEFNKIVSSFQGIIKGRMGLPLVENDISVISLVIDGEKDSINDLTEKLDKLDNVHASVNFSETSVH